MVRRNQSNRFIQSRHKSPNCCSWCTSRRTACPVAVGALKPSSKRRLQHELSRTPNQFLDVPNWNIYLSPFMEWTIQYDWVRWSIFANSNPPSQVVTNRSISNPFQTRERRQCTSRTRPRRWRRRRGQNVTRWIERNFLLDFRLPGNPSARFGDAVNFHL